MDLVVVGVLTAAAIATVIMLTGIAIALGGLVTWVAARRYFARAAEELRWDIDELKAQNLMLTAAASDLGGQTRALARALEELTAENASLKEHARMVSDGGMRLNELVARLDDLLRASDPSPSVNGHASTEAPVA